MRWGSAGWAWWRRATDRSSCKRPAAFRDSSPISPSPPHETRRCSSPSTSSTSAPRSPWASSRTRCSRRSLHGRRADPAGPRVRAHHLVSGRTGSGRRCVLGGELPGSERRGATEAHAVPRPTDRQHEVDRARVAREDEAESAAAARRLHLLRRLHVHRLDRAVQAILVAILVALVRSRLPVVRPGARGQRIGLVERRSADAQRAAVERRVVRAPVAAAQADGRVLGEAAELLLGRVAETYLQRELRAGERLTGASHDLGSHASYRSPAHGGVVEGAVRTEREIGGCLRARHDELRVTGETVARAVRDGVVHVTAHAIAEEVVTVEAGAEAAARESTANDAAAERLDTGFAEAAASVRVEEERVDVAGLLATGRERRLAVRPAVVVPRGDDADLFEGEITDVGNPEVSSEGIEAHPEGIAEAPG